MLGFLFLSIVGSKYLDKFLWNINKIHFGWFSRRSPECVRFISVGCIQVIFKYFSDDYQDLFEVRSFLLREEYSRFYICQLFHPFCPRDFYESAVFSTKHAISIRQ